MRIFQLHRDTDPTGVSGTGVVAAGVEWDDGTVAVRWRGDHPTTVHHDEGMASVYRIHGHGGATRVVWLGYDGRELADVPAWAELEDAYGKRVDVTGSSSAEAYRVWIHAEDGAAHLDDDMAVQVRDALNAWLLWLGHPAAYRPAAKEVIR